MSNGDNEEGLTPVNPDEVPADSGLYETGKPSDDGSTFPVELSNHVVVIDGSKRNTTAGAATDFNFAGASESSPSRRTIAVRRISAPLLPMPVFASVATAACSGPTLQLQNRRGSGGSGLLTTADEPYVFSRTQLSGTTTAIHPVERDLRTAVGNVVSSSTASGARRRLSDPVCGRSWYSNRANWSAAVMSSSSSSSFHDTWTSAFAGGNFDVGSRRSCCQTSSGATATPPPSPTSTTAPDGSISGSGFADHGTPRRRHSLALGQLSSTSQLNAIDEEGAGSNNAGGETSCNHLVSVNCASSLTGEFDSNVVDVEGLRFVATTDGEKSTSESNAADASSIPLFHT